MVYPRSSFGESDREDITESFGAKAWNAIQDYDQLLSVRLIGEKNPPERRIIIDYLCSILEGFAPAIFPNETVEMPTEAEPRLIEAILFMPTPKQERILIFSVLGLLMIGSSAVGLAGWWIWKMIKH